MLFLSDLGEVTYGISGKNNIAVISFLIGFGGISVWLQIFALSKSFNVKFSLFALSRILHGLISAMFSVLFCKIFDVDTGAFSANGKIFKIAFLNPFLCVCLFISIVVLIFELKNKNNSGNGKENVV